MNINIDDIETAFYMSLTIRDIEKVLIERLGVSDIGTKLYLKKQLDSFEKQVSDFIKIKDFLRPT